MNSIFKGLGIQKWVRRCVWSMLLCTLIVFPSLIFGYNVVAKYFGAVLIAASMFSLVTYSYQNRHLKIPQKAPRRLYSLLLICVCVHIIYGVFFDKSYVPLTFWGNIDFAPAFLTPLFLMVGMRKGNILWILKVLAFFSLLTIPMLIVGYTYTLYIGWTLFFPLAFAKFLPKKIMLALLASGLCYMMICWFEGARTPVLRTAIAMLIAAYTYLKPFISRRLANLLAIVVIVVPFYYFFLYVSTGVSVFDSELSAHSSSLGDNADDTRTFLYEEVLDDLADTKTIWFGKGINGKYYSSFFVHSLADSEYRTNPEVGFLSYLLKGGIVYTVIMILLQLLAVFRALSIRNSIVAQIFGLLIVQHIFLLFIENVPQYTLYNMVIWCVIGFAFSPELYNVDESEVSNLFDCPGRKHKTEKSFQTR